MPLSCPLSPPPISSDARGGIGSSLSICLELVLKPRLRPDLGVAGLLKILTYDFVCCVFSSACALTSDLIRGFETSPNPIQYNIDSINFTTELIRAKSTRNFEFDRLKVTGDISPLPEILPPSRSDEHGFLLSQE
jgi:hypothetical protein